MGAFLTLDDVDVALAGLHLDVQAGDEVLDLFHHVLEGDDHELSRARVGHELGLDDRAGDARLLGLLQALCKLAQLGDGRSRARPDKSAEAALVSKSAVPAETERSGH